MKTNLLFIAAGLLAGGLALAQEPETTNDSNDWGDVQDQSSEMGDQIKNEASTPRMDQETMEQTATDRTTTDLSDMSAADLDGKTIVTPSGEEIGVIEKVGTRENRVAVVDVGGYLGISEKSVAIPLSELKMSTDGNVETALTKDSIENAEEFDEQNFTEESADESATTDEPHDY